MRLILCSALLIAAACSSEPEPAMSAGLFAGVDRDALCIAGEPGEQRGGFITYGKGDMNCSAKGSIVADGGQFALVPQGEGEGECRFPLTQNPDGVTIGTPESCSYYCGPGLSAEGRTFRRMGSGASSKSAPDAVTDLAGDPLC
ncbi:hypothetical protein [Sphingomonas xanthus]|uniref:Uncharacterized protein n=1 Tax=Sphingomonas xanthus TaxID=2594473 RepID=A0A516IT86_9SPHN|nr:hypothetical protein [Sphingomonas xanthus]QDP20107.1 hypothetical protein FMM02_09185 [Sphingomonas xanthus]